MTHVRLSPAIFREYDIRGVAGQELTLEAARLIGQAFGEWLIERAGETPGETGGPGPAAGPGTVALGRDNRLSSPALAGAIAGGLEDAGWNIADLGVIPTPVFYFSRLRYGFDAGVMVTGSHNAAEFNGFKLAHGPGTLQGSDIAAIGAKAARLAGRGDGPPRPSRRRPPFEVASDRPPFGPRSPLEDYKQDLLERLRLERDSRPLRVAVDCGSGTASLVAPGLLAELGCDVLPLYSELDGSFPGHWPDPTKPENLAELSDLVRREKADLGIAFDGDADRLGVVDDRGEIVWGDILMILFWREILARSPGQRALVEVKCSQALVDEIRRLGGEPFFHRTGHSPIKATMREIGALFAGEMSGHMFFADEYYGFDDAIYAAARLLRILAREGRPLSDLLADRPRYVSTREVRLDCPDDVKVGVVEAVRERFRREGLEVIDVDGARVVFPDGWLLVRASNTQPAVVARCEARSEEVLKALTVAAAEALRKTPMGESLGEIKW